jgi:hypothetical protein
MPQRAEEWPRDENSCVCVGLGPPRPQAHCAFSLRLFPFPSRHAHTRHTQHAAAMPPRHDPDQVSPPCPVASGVGACVSARAKSFCGGGGGARKRAGHHTLKGRALTDAAPLHTSGPSGPAAPPGGR